MILIIIGSSQDLDMKAQIGEDNHLATAMDPWSRGGLLTHHFGGRHGDEEGLRWWFLSLVGCREELLDPPDGGLQYFSWMEARALRVFWMKWINRRRGDVRRRLGGPHQGLTWPGGRLRHPMVQLPPGSSLSLLRTLSSCQVNRKFGFCFV
jgi:hypothetical protein